MPTYYPFQAEIRPCQ